MKIYRFQAIFMILIILTLPLYSSVVFAAPQLTVTRYSGDDKVNGFLDADEAISLEVDAVIDGDDDITAEQVKINGVVFDSCSAGAPGHFLCVFRGGPYFINAGTYNLDFSLLSDADEIVRSALRSLTYDVLSPFVQFDRNPVQSAQEVSVAYTVKDMAFEAGNFNLCSGLQRVEFWDSASKLDEVILNGECVHTDTVVLPVPSSNRITIKAYDKLGHAASVVSPSFTIDNNAPVIIPESFGILRNGVELEDMISNKPFSATIGIRIREEHLDASQVTADLTSLGLGVVAASSCSPQGRDFLCKWNDVLFSFTQSTTLSILFSAEDTFGNTASATVTRSFSIDSTSPVVTFIGTAQRFGDKSYMGVNPTDVIVQIRESGSGLFKKQIFLDLAGINSANPSSLQADACLQTGNEWTCKWFNKTTTRNHGTFPEIFLVYGSDDAGNAVTGKTRASIVIDKRPPHIDEFDLRAISAAEARTDFIVSNDRLVIFMNGTEESQISAVGNFSMIYEGGMIAADCDKNGEIFACAWDIPSVLSGYILTTVLLTFTDSAGNEAIFDIPIEIFARDDEESPDYWRVRDIELMPSALDRQTAPLIRQRAYAWIKLMSPQGAELVEAKLGECTGDTGFLNGLSIFNNQRGSTDPYIVFELKTIDAAGLDELNINCNLDIVSLYADRISQVEREQLNITIPFYNNPLGEASEELNNKIEDLKDTYVDGWWKFITGIRKFWNYAVMICRAITTFYRVTQLYGLLKDNLNKVFTVTANPAVAAATVDACYMSETTKATSDRTYKFGTKLCKFVNCQMLTPEENEQLPKWGKWWGNWQSFGYSVMGQAGGDFIQRWTGGDSPAALVPDDYLNPKESFPVALLTGCVPGILHGLDTYRQIQCQYISCLEDGIETGVPEDACDKLKSYETCKYFTGEIFNVIPFTAAFDWFMGTIKSTLSDPFRIVGVGLSVACRQLCPVTPNFPHSVCFWGKVLSMLGEVIGDVETIIDKDSWTLAGDYCSQVESTPEEKGQSILEEAKAKSV